MDSRNHNQQQQQHRRVCVSRSSSKDAGDGLFLARTSIDAGGAKEGEVIFKEKPLVAMQTVANRQDIIVCTNCLRPIGTVYLQLSLLSRRISRAQFSDPDIQLADGDVELSPIIPCANHCGELYCSPSCQVAHFEMVHKYLCVGALTDEEAVEHPLMQFKVHAVNSNEIFLLVADVFTKIRGKFDNLLTDGCEPPSACDLAREPFASFVQNKWWEVAFPPDDSPVDELRLTLQQLVLHSCELLQSAIGVPELAFVFIPDYFGAIVGMFEQNNVGIRLESPVATFVRDLLQGDPQDPVVQLVCEYVLPIVTLAVEAMQQEQDDDDALDDQGDERVAEQGNGVAEGLGETKDNQVEDEDEELENSAFGQLKALVEENSVLEGDAIDCHCQTLFPPLDGTALYTLICKMNHSCEPNTMVRYTVDEVHGLMAEVVALTDIGAGGELTQSYIDASAEYDERQWALRDYGFVCSCTKCVRERPQP